MRLFTWIMARMISARHARRGVFALLLPLLLVTAAVAESPATPTVRLVLSGEGGAYQAVAEAFQEALEERLGGRVAVARIPLEEWRARPSPAPASGDAALTVTVGNRAAARVMAADGTPDATPVLAVLIPRQRFHELARDHHAAHSAIYLDQPLSRQLRLIREALPERRALGVLFGPSSSAQEGALSAQVARYGLTLRHATMASGENHVERVREVIDADGVFLALPDPVVFNARSVRNILLTTYRVRTPLIGFSRAYAKAGALLALFTTPEQVGRQAAEVVAEAFTEGGGRLPPPLEPNDFTIAVNDRVARSLGLSPPSARELERRLSRPEGTR